jgi:hypothetical protein
MRRFEMGTARVLLWSIDVTRRYKRRTRGQQIGHWKCGKRDIKAVGADASFVWNHGVEGVSITNLSYFSAYSGMGTKFLDTPPSADAFSKELAAKLALS